MDSGLARAELSAHCPDMGFTYILLCSDGTYYTGSTRDIIYRFGQHVRGEGAEYTRRRRPVELVYYEWYSTVREAFLREKQIQGMLHSHKRRIVNGGPGYRPGEPGWMF